MNFWATNIDTRNFQMSWALGAEGGGGPADYTLIFLAFIAGNSSLEHLLEGLFAQIHIDLSWRGFGRNRTGDLRITQIC